MTGGVWEWCVTGPDSSGAQRVLRGGAWRMLDPAERADCVYRLTISTDKEGQPFSVSDAQPTPSSPDPLALAPPGWIQPGATHKESHHA